MGVGTFIGSLNTAEPWVLEGAPRVDAEQLDVLRFARERLGFLPDELQARVLTSTARRGVLNCCRQWGKSTVAAVKALYEAYSVPESLIIVASPTERQSGEFVHKASGLARRLGGRVRGDGKNSISLALENGSRIVGLPGTDDTTRGFSAVRMLVVDEAARVPDSVYRSLTPMLAVSGGAVWLLSTPYGATGFFHEAWVGVGDSWERFEARAPECSRISAEFLEEERRQMGASIFGQEYLCEFVSSGRQRFSRELVRGALWDGAALGL
jgi:hypothetical protein